MNARSLVFLVIALALAVSVIPSSAARAEAATSFEWSRQFNAGERAPVYMAVDSGAIYAASGGTLWKYGADGGQVWAAELDVEGGPNHNVTSISAYGGGIYLAGTFYCNPETTSGDFCGGFIRKCDTNGQEAWTQYLETAIVWSPGWAVFAGDTGVYLAGNTYSWETETQDGFLRRYDAGGSEAWVIYLGFGNLDTRWGVCADAAGVYVTGDSAGSGSESETVSRFLGMYDTTGQWLWNTQYSLTGFGEASVVCADAGGVCVADGESGWVRKYNTNGQEAWTRQVVSIEGARVLGLAAGDGGVYAAGSVTGAIEGQTSHGGTDAFIARLDGIDGTRSWIRQFGTSADDAATAAAAVGGGVYLGGTTGGTQPGSQGAGHGFLSLLTANQYPDRPRTVSPAGGAADVSLTPVLQGSAFADADGDGHAASLWQIRSTTGSYDSPAYDSGSVPGSTSITVPAGALSSFTSYYWRVGYQDSRGLWSRYSQETSFTTADTAVVLPAVETVPAGGVGSTSATLGLSLTGLGSADSVEVSFDWGPGTDYGSSTTPQAMTGIGTFSLDLSGLTPATTYHFRAKAEGGGTAYGGDLTFTTLAVSAIPPGVDTGDASRVTGSSAQLRGELTSPGTAGSVSVAFIWGTAPGGAYPNETAGSDLTAGGIFEFDLAGLAPGTTFYYRARAVGDGTSYGEEKSFSTSGQEPVLGSLAADSGRPGDELTVSLTGANLTGTTGVDFGAGIITEEYSVVSDGEVTARIVIGNGAPTGERTVTVTTPWGTGSIPGGFQVNGVVTRVRLWVYLVGAAGALAGLALAVSAGVWLRRRLAK